MAELENKYFITDFLNYDINNIFSTKKRKLIPFIKSDRSLFCLKSNNRFRRIVKLIVESKVFVNFIMVTIFANCLVLSMYVMFPNNDTNIQNNNLEQTDPWFLLIFTIECVMKIISYGFVLHPKSYLRNFWNILDFSIVSLGYLTIILTALAQGKVDVKALRAFRVLRPLRLLSRLPSLQIVLNSIIIAMKPLADIGLLVIFLIIVFAIIGISLFMGSLHTTCYNNITNQIMPNPKPCSLNSTAGFLCSKLTPLPIGQWVCLDLKNTSGVTRYSGPSYGIASFDNIWLAIITIFIVLTKQGWTEILYSINDVYGSYWPWIYFIPILIIGSYFTLNLILGVLCGQLKKEKGKVELRRRFVRERQKLKEEQDFIFYKSWIETAESLDNTSLDNESIITRTDSQRALVIDQNRNTNDANTVMQNSLDERKKAERDAKRKEYLKRISDSQKYIREIIKTRNYFVLILALVFINTIILATEFYNQPQWLTNFQNYSNILFVILFTIEMIIKIFALGFKAYFSKIFNVYDFLIITSSILELSLTLSNTVKHLGLSMLRCLRLLRIFKLTRYWEDLRTLVRKMLRSIKSIMSLLLLLILFVIISSLLGMQLFGGKFNFDPSVIVRSNFDNMGQSIFTVIELISLEQWSLIMFNGIQSYGGANSIGSVASLYFIIVLVIGNYILLNVFFAIFYEILSSDNSEEEKAKKAKQMQKLKDSEIETDKVEAEFDVPVLENLVVINGNTLIPPNSDNDIISLNPVKKKSRKHAAVEHRVRINFRENDDIGIIMPDAREVSKLTFKELYAEEEEDAIIIDTSKKPIREPLIELKPELSAIPIGTSLFFLESNNKFRVFCHRFISHSFTQNIVLVIIIFSSIMLAFSDPLQANPSLENVIDLFNYFFLAVFIVELMINFIAYGIIFHKGAFLRSAFNWLDFIVVTVGILDICLPAVQLSASKTLRVLRIIKTLRNIKQAKELKHIINTLGIAFGKVGRILLVALLLIFVCAVIGVNLFKGGFFSCTDISKRTQSTCIGTYIAYSYDGLYTPTFQKRVWKNRPLNFDNIFISILTLFSVSTYQGWTNLLYETIDSTSESMGPYLNNNQAVFLFYIIFIIFIRLFMINIFIVFIVLSYQEARKSKYKIQQLNKNQKQCLAFVLKCRPIDRYIPLHSTYRYKIWKVVISNAFNYSIFVIIILNTISMSLQFDQASASFLNLLRIFNFVFIALFSIEAILKILAFNIRNYFDDSMNIFDCIVVLGSYVDIVFSEINGDSVGVSINIFRLFRVLRLVKLLMKIKSIRRLLWTFIKSFKTIPWIMLLLILFMYIYTIIGMQFFGTIGINNPNSAINFNNNFQNLMNTLLVLFRCTTGEQWQKIMNSCLDTVEAQCQNSNQSCSNVTAYIYFPTYVLLCVYVIMNLFLAVIMDNFDYLTNDKSILSPHHLEDFIEKWSEYDVGGKGRIRPLDVVNLLTKIDPPLGFGSMCPHKKCMKKLMYMDMPLEKDGTILLQSTLFALVRRNMKIKLPTGDNDPKPMEKYNEELRLIMKKLFNKIDPAMIDTILPSNVSNSITVGRFYAIFIIQDMFRKYKCRKRDNERKKILESMVYQDEQSIIHSTYTVEHREVEIPENREKVIDPLEIVQNNVEKLTDTFWTNLRKIFILQDDDDSKE